MLRNLLTGFVLFVSLSVFAQEKGFLRGNILDGDFGGPMLGATVSLADQPGVGTVTDIDGNFSLPIEPGKHKINVSFVSYATQSFEVEIKPGEVTILDATMTASVEMLEAFEVTAKARRNSETAMLLDMKKATNVTDGLSAQSFRKVGDNDLGGAIKRVTGVTVQNGKHVYVRGLGDRYTKTTLNGMTIPGLDPDKNSVQIDIFPTAVLENVSVSKTFSPNLDGDFTGGLVNIVTKKFPEEKTSNISVGMRYIPGMHFNENYMLYNRGSMDWAGYDDGTRALPFSKTKEIPDPALRDPELTEATKAFNPNLAVKKATALPNMSFSFNHGNQINKESGNTFGYNVVFNYRNETAFYEDFESNDVLKDNNKDNVEMVPQRLRKGDVSKNNVNWSGLVTGSWKRDNNTISLSVLNSQNGETTASKRLNSDVEQNQARLVEDILTYSQRNLSVFMVNGSHRTGLFEIEWGNATSFSRVYDPDFRETRISITDGDTTLQTGAGAGIDRFWRDLNETNNSTKADVKYQATDKLVLKAGALATLKWREFETQAYKHRTTNLSDVSIDPDWYLQEENIWTIPDDPAVRPEGTYTIGNFQPTNQYEARQNLFAGYLQAEHPLFSKLRLIYGARIEKVDMFYTGENNAGTIVYNDTNTLDVLNVLPSLNMVYELNDKMNLRGAVNQTVARPTFKEKSIAQIYDPITKRTFVGNIDLEQTTINNYDVRWEYYLSPKELISVAGFYKQFDGHIEMVSFTTAPDNLIPRNSGNAQVYGAEFEVRKSLAPAGDTSFISRFFVSANLSLVQSMVDMQSVFTNNTQTLTEYEVRVNNARTGQTIDQFRPMAGQSPYAVNVSGSYEFPERKGTISLTYNVQGEQLSIVGSGRVPDIYTIPFHSLNFNAFRNFGKELQHRITFSVNNILDGKREMIYKSFEAENMVFTTFKPGIGIGLKYAYQF